MNSKMLWMDVRVCTVKLCAGYVNIFCKTGFWKAPVQGFFVHRRDIIQTVRLEFFQSVQNYFRHTLFFCFRVFGSIQVNVWPICFKCGIMGWKKNNNQKIYIQPSAKYVQFVHSYNVQCSVVDPDTVGSWTSWTCLIRIRNNLPGSDLRHRILYI